MKEIQLTQGKFAIVDDSEYERLNQHKWYAQKGGGTFYAARFIKKPDGKRATIYMHREILGLKFGDPRQGDHRNHNTLDNRRDKLRVCTNKQNHQNMRPYKNCSSAYKGVSWNKDQNKWEVYIHCDGKKKRLGFYESEIIAAKVYDKAAISIFGSFAKINF